MAQTECLLMGVLDHQVSLCACMGRTLNMDVCVLMNNHLHIVKTVDEVGRSPISITGEMLMGIKLKDTHAL